MMKTKLDNPEIVTMVIFICLTAVAIVNIIWG